LSEAAATGSRGGRARVEIDLGALERNFRVIAAEVAPARVMPVVKADAYGHGAVEVARALEPLGAAGFAVARVEEGIELREAGIRAEILVCSPAHPETLDLLARHALSPVVSSLAQLAGLERFAAASGWRPAVHLKVDTGMHRLGVPLDEVDAAFECLRGARALDWRGLLSHLADGEHPDGAATARQGRAFAAVVGRLSPDERARIAVHLANSAGALAGNGSRHDLVRPGWALYGGAVDGSRVALEPVLALRARVLQVQEVEPGDSIGYGGRWTAARPSRVGIVGLGYADGYPWRAGGAAEALAAGRRVPVVGAVSMDLLAVDLTGVSCETGDEVTLLGGLGEERIRVEELAARSGTIGYEILCHLRMRLPRQLVSSSAPVARAAAEARR